MSRYTKVRQIRKDPFISTFLVEDRLHHGRFFNLKIFRSSFTENDRLDFSKMDFLDLLSKLTELRHPFCTRYYEVYVQVGVIHVLTEHVHPGPLDALMDECLRVNEKLSETLVLRWIAELCFALIYLEDNEIFLIRLPISATALFGSSCAKIVDVEVRTRPFIFNV